MYSTRTHYILVSIKCFLAYAAAQAQGIPMFIVVFMVAVILHKETSSKISPGEHITIDIPSQISLPPKTKNKEESNADQRNLDVSNVDSILHQALIAGQNYKTGVVSQAAQSPTQATAVAESPAQVPELKTAVRVAFLVISISAGGIFSVVAGLIENKNMGLTHKVLFKAYLSLSYISFSSGVVLFLLTLMPGRLPRLILIVKITMWTTVGTVTYAIGCAICVILLTSLVAVVLVLVAPLFVVFLLVILSFSSFSSYRN